MAYIKEGIKIKHWFVKWLLNKVEEEKELALKYFEYAKLETHEAKLLLEAFPEEGIIGILQLAEKFKANATRLMELTNLIEDMINCGLEELAIAYYDAKQALEPWQLEQRPQQKTNWSITGLFENLEARIESNINSNELVEVKDILTTLTELYSTGMSDIALKYYFIKKRQNPELNLPEPDILEED